MSCLGKSNRAQFLEKNSYCTEVGQFYFNLSPKANMFYSQMSLQGLDNGITWIFIESLDNDSQNSLTVSAIARSLSLVAGVNIIRIREIRVYISSG